MATPNLQAALARARAALERGRGLEAVQALQVLLRSRTLSKDDDLAVRIAIAEGHLQMDDLTQAAVALGRPPEQLKEPLPDATLSTLWRLHGRLTYARGDQSRAIALHTRALKFAERARDSHAIGLAHFELAQCYRKIGDAGILREHLTKASAALHAAGDRRHLALAHRLSGVLLGQNGRVEEAALAFGQAERLATAIRADDVVASAAHNRANLALLTRRLDEARTLAERSVGLFEALGSGHGLAVSLATLGQIYAQLGALDQAEQTLHRALEVRSPIKFHETTGAVFDTLAQIHLMRGNYDRASDYLKQAGEAYTAQGSQAARWYDWSVRLLEVKIATRRGAHREACALADELAASPGIPLADAVQAGLAACEALLAAGCAGEARARLHVLESSFDARADPANWGAFLRVRGSVLAALGERDPAYHDFSQSANLFELLGERYQSASSHLALAKLAAGGGARQAAARSLDVAEPLFRTLGADADAAEAQAVRDGLADLPVSPNGAHGHDTDDALVRRLIDASILPDLLASEFVDVANDLQGAHGAVLFVEQASADPHVVAAAGLDAGEAVAAARAASGGPPLADGLTPLTESLGHAANGSRRAAILVRDRQEHRVDRRFQMCAAVARQGFDLCVARERPAPAAIQSERAVELLLPGFICSSAAMTRVAEQIKRLQGHTLTVLITGESGTGKELVARAIHAGSPRSESVYLPFNCTTTTRELADSQLFGHRRGSFTGAVSDQPGIIRSAASGTLFLDEIGDIPIDVQPKLLRFLEQGEILPVGETRPVGVDVRVLAATNADLEQRVADGSFREDLYYRLSIIRIEVPPLRDRREEIPHLCAYFLRESSERLDKPDMQLSSAALDALTQFWWPGNVRQLRNEIQRAVAMSPPGGMLEPEHFSAEVLSDARDATRAETAAPAAHATIQPGNLIEAVEHLERGIISTTLERTGRNISEAARVLGLTRRGLYLKMRRLGIAEA